MATAAMTAKRALLQLLNAAGQLEVPASALVSAGRILGFSENNVRVAIARLLAAGTVELTGRGLYRLGERGQELGTRVRGWRDLERQVAKKWDGGWACVDLSNVSRTADRSSRARLERSLRLLGFRSLSKALEVRPDNLDGGVDALRQRLFAFATPSRGEEPLVFHGMSFDDATDTRARGLWDVKKLVTSYRQTRERIDRWINHAESLDDEAAAREAFHFGGDVLKQIVFDPRLPEPLVNVSERRAMLEAARRLDAFGRRLWQRLFAIPHGLIVVHEEDHEHLGLH